MRASLRAEHWLDAQVTQAAVDVNPFAIAMAKFRLVVAARR